MVGTLVNRKQAGARRGGFTLMEVMLVLVILVVIASMAAMALAPRQRKAQIDAARAQIRAFKGPLEAFRMDMGDYPMGADGLQALRHPPGGGDAGKWGGPYLDREVPNDPWGRPYQYRYPGTGDPILPDIISAGPDRIPGNDDDIVSWAAD
jgi:general secretion pathway protein G